jgi:hypothetical protein
MEMTMQQRSNVAYLQCRYARSNNVPGDTGAAIASSP